MASDVLYIAPSGLFQIGIVTPFGIQTSIESFLSLSEAKSWARKNGVRLQFSVENRVFREADIVLIGAIDGCARPADAALVAKRSPSAIFGTLVRLEKIGLVTIDRAKSRKDWRFSATDVARKAVSSFAKDEDSASTDPRNDATPEPPAQGGLV